MWIRYKLQLGKNSKKPEGWSYREVEDYYKDFKSGDFAENIYEDYFRKYDNQGYGEINFEVEAIDIPPKEALENFIDKFEIQIKVLKEKVVKFRQMIDEAETKRKIPDWI